MIVLLSYSTSWCQNKVTIPFTGVVEQGDTLIEVPISTIKIANSKMVELKYQKQINAGLKEIVLNDSIIIKGLQNNIAVEQNKSKKYKKQRNIVGGTGIGLLILLIISLL